MPGHLPLPAPGELPLPMPGDLPAAPLPLPTDPVHDAPTVPADSNPTTSSTSLSEKVESSEYGSLWAKRSEKPLQQIYGHIDRISNKEAGTLLDRYADRFGHSLDREIIVMRKASLEEKKAEIRDAPTVELIGQDEAESLSPAEELKAVETELRQLKPLYQEAKSTGNQESLAELKPVLTALMARRKALKNEAPSTQGETTVAAPAEINEIDDLFEQFVVLSNDLLGDHLPEDVVAEFMNSSGFELLKEVHASPTTTSEETRREFYAMVDDLLGNMPDDSINAFVSSPEFEIYSRIGEVYKGA